MVDTSVKGIVEIKARLEKAVSDGDIGLAASAISDLQVARQMTSDRSSVDRFMAENDGLIKEACRLYFVGRGDVLNNMAVGFVTLNI
jgi:hypothetical protein